MKTYNIKNMKGGWFIGNFEPSVFKNPFFEVAHHFHEAGYIGPKHYHKIAPELSYIVSGNLIASGRKLSTGDMFVYEPGDIADVEFLEDTNLIVVKWPSVPSDKYMVEE
jgi:quercetin dioxygenase-like cupin family protein|tara:strand:+ start:1178 stop:1504 length:327 start_codon:yes stop_codon:yes gene_type:complete